MKKKIAMLMMVNINLNDGFIGSKYDSIVESMKDSWIPMCSIVILLIVILRVHSVA
uniref:Uncharacterized protein n=1 Tax=Tetranychus urticae TaxID=32264 RepID=T1JUG2_TETUR